MNEKWCFYSWHSTEQSGLRSDVIKPQISGVVFIDGQATWKQSSTWQKVSFECQDQLESGTPLVLTPALYFNLQKWMTLLYHAMWRKHMKNGQSTSWCFELVDLLLFELESCIIYSVESYWIHWITTCLFNFKCIHKLILTVWTYCTYKYIQIK